MSIWILIDDGHVIADINLCVTVGQFEKAPIHFFLNFNASLVKRQSNNQIILRIVVCLPYTYYCARFVKQDTCQIFVIALKLVPKI